MQLFIAEKPSLGMAIAQGLGIKEKNRGYIVCENETVVTWCVGHILELCPASDYDPAYKKWSVESLPIIPSDWKIKPKDNTISQFNIIKDLVKRASSLVNAGDPDRSGTRLVDEVIEYLESTLPVKRILISDTNPKPVKKALNNMVDNSVTKQLSLSALGRVRADWIVGINLTRLYSCLSNDNGGDALVSIGRIQTPILALIVKRCKDVEAFIPKPFYGIKGAFETGGKSLKMEWVASNSLNDNTQCDFDEKKRLLNKDLANSLINKCKGMTPVISLVHSKPSKSRPPLVFSLKNLQIEANKRFKYSIQKTLDLTQFLYDMRLVSYPRSDCSYLPVEQFEMSKDIVNVVLNNCNNDDFSGLEYDFENKSPSFNDALIGAHHGIVPTEKKLNEKLSKDLINIYELICERFLMQFLGDKVTEKSLIEVNFGGLDSTFKMSGEVLIKQGYSILTAKKEDSLLPVVVVGQSIDSFKLSLSTKKTSKPELYTDATLLEGVTNIARYVEDVEIKKILKETDGLGTEATRAGIFELLIERDFVQRKNNKLISTESGTTLIESLPLALTTPDLTAKWEHQLEKIVNDEISVDDFIVGVSDSLRTIIDLSKNSSIKILKNYHKCPLCSKKLNLVKTANGDFWGCIGYRDNTCKFTAKDKKNSPDLSVKKANEKSKEPINKCDKCNAEIVRKKKKPKGEEVDSYFWVHAKSNVDCDKFINDFSHCKKCKGKILRIYSIKKNFYFWRHEVANDCDTFIKDKEGKPQ
jgi:DNA topoisomerase-3